MKPILFTALEALFMGLTKCVSSLEAAIIQADNEADVIIRLQDDLNRDES